MDLITNSSLIISTTLKPTTTTQTIIGFLFIIGQVICAGSCYLPAKKYPSGDGMFFQLIFSLGYWLVAILVYLIRNNPQFYALPMLGGFFFSSKC